MKKAVFISGMLIISIVCVLAINILNFILFCDGTNDTLITDITIVTVCATVLMDRFLAGICTYIENKNDKDPFKFA